MSEQVCTECKNTNGEHLPRCHRYCERPEASMTDKPEIAGYDKINHWYGWNGGECPVHPETVVRVRHLDDSDYTQPANKSWGWGGVDSAHTIFAFQIIRPYVPPPATVKREVALYRGHSAFVADTGEPLDENVRRISHPETIEFAILPGESAE